MIVDGDGNETNCLHLSCNHILHINLYIYIFRFCMCMLILYFFICKLHYATLPVQLKNVEIMHNGFGKGLRAAN
jgi:hypothetical protein